MASPNDFGKEIKLIQRAIVTGRKVGADRTFWVRLSENKELFSAVVDLVMSDHVHHHWGWLPTITPISFPRDYNRTLVAMRDAMKCDGHVEQLVNDANFPVDARDDDRRIVLVCFNRAIVDHEDPEKSELMFELDKLGLQPEGPPELCMVGEHHPNLQCMFPIVARRQVWRDPHDVDRYPFLVGSDGIRQLGLLGVRGMYWSCNYRFLASYK